MKAIFIDSENQEIKQVEVSGLKDLQKCVNGYIEVAVYEKGNVMYVDEEGLFKGYEWWFKYGSSQPFAGNGIIVGDDGEGNDIDSTFTIEEVKEKVAFIPMQLDKREVK